MMALLACAAAVAQRLPGTSELFKKGRGPVAVIPMKGASIQKCTSNSGFNHYTFHGTLLNWSNLPEIMASASTRG